MSSEFFLLVGSFILGHFCSTWMCWNVPYMSLIENVFEYVYISIFIYIYHIHIYSLLESYIHNLDQAFRKVIVFVTKSSKCTRREGLPSCA